LKFEVQARGVITDDTGALKNDYVWKSRVGSGVSVIQSLTFDGDIEVDDTWMANLVQKIAERVADQITDAGIDEKVIAAETARDEAKTARDEAIAAKNEAEIIAENKANEVVSGAIDNINSRIDDVVEDLENAKTELS